MSNLELEAGDLVYYRYCNLYKIIRITRSTIWLTSNISNIDQTDDHFYIPKNRALRDLENGILMKHPEYAKRKLIKRLINE